MRNFIKKLKEFEAYDRVYYGGKLCSLIVVILSFLAIGCFVLACLICK